MAERQSRTAADAAQQFFRYFQEESTALQERMDRLGEVSTIGGERMDAVNHCLAGISQLQKKVQDASSYTSSYDQRMYSEGIKALFEKLEGVKVALAPKNKFAFKSTLKKNNSAISLTDAAELARQKNAKLFEHQSGQDTESSGMSTPSETPTPPTSTPSRPAEPHRRGSLGNFLAAAGIERPDDGPSISPPAKVQQLPLTSEKSVVINSHTSVFLVQPPSHTQSTSSRTLTDLRHCIVDMSGRTATSQAFAGLTIRDVRHSLLLCGNVSGATHVTKVEGSVIVVATGQLRLHECHNCKVYLHVKSQPVIEDCKNISFAPLPERYLQQAEHATIDNKWDQAQDFNWPRSTASPNWRKLEKEERISDEVWKRITVGPDWSLSRLLSAVGILPFGSRSR